MSHREQHFAGMHYARIDQIGVKYDNPEDKPYSSEDSPNSPSLAQLRKLHDRVYTKKPRDYFKDDILGFYNAGLKAQCSLEIAMKYGFTYTRFQNCSKCGAKIKKKKTAVAEGFSFPVWFCPNCKNYRTAFFKGVNTYTCNGCYVVPQKLIVADILGIPTSALQK